MTSDTSCSHKRLGDRRAPYPHLERALCPNRGDGSEQGLPSPTRTPIKFASTIDKTDLVKVCTKLAQQLRTAEFSSIKTIQANETLLGTAFGAQFDDINRLVQCFDFEEALQALKSAAASWDIDV